MPSASAAFLVTPACGKAGCAAGSWRSRPEFEQRRSDMTGPASLLRSRHGRGDFFPGWPWAPRPWSEARPHPRRLHAVFPLAAKGPSAFAGTLREKSFAGVARVRGQGRGRPRPDSGRTLAGLWPDSGRTLAVGGDGQCALWSGSAHGFSFTRRLAVAAILQIN